MDKNLARRLLNIVESHNPALEEYAQWRIKELRDKLEQANTLEEMKTLKGRLIEVRDLLKMRERVFATLGDK